MAVLGRCVSTGTVKDSRMLRQIPLEALVQVCQRGVEVGLPPVNVSRLLRNEIEKRKIPLCNITENMISFLGACLPEAEAAELVKKTARINKKRDLAAFVADFPETD